MHLSDFAKMGLRRVDNRPIHLRPGAILCFVCVRNESLRLPYFLDYHRKLGVERFFVVDNASEDATQQLLIHQSDVHVFVSTGSYAASNYGVGWLNNLLSHFASGHWALTLDADELLIYPHCETLPLGKLVGYLEERRFDGLQAFLIDMYANRPICQTDYHPGT